MILDAEANAEVMEGVDFVRRAPKLMQLLEAVCTVFRVSKMDVMSARRYDYIIGARDTFYYLARHMTPRTHEEIGRFLGDRDHTTIIKGVSRISRRLSKHRAKLAEVVTLLGADPEDVLP